MLKMVLCLHFFLLYCALTVAGQEATRVLTLHDSVPVTLQGLSNTGEALGVFLRKEHLTDVSNSVLLAERWIRSHVLVHYPAINITTIVVDRINLCEKAQKDKLDLILPASKNIYYSLTRWGLQREIKVSASFSSSCLQQEEGPKYRDDSANTFLKPLLDFLQDIESPYLINLSSKFSVFPRDTERVLDYHSKFLKNLGLSNLKMINVVVAETKELKPTSRKLSSIDPKIIDSFPARPTQLNPSLAPTGSSAPAYAAKSPLPPLIGEVSPSPLSLPFAPELPPWVNPATPPFGPHLPPCRPSDEGSPVGAPVAEVHGGVWCVAKPSVPPEILQEALDYACGEGGADCEAIRPHGSCYFPNTVVAHASYAFNSYWQRTKKNGGTCGFGGTAMLINSDPSYRHCRFTLP